MTESENLAAWVTCCSCGAAFCLDEEGYENQELRLCGVCWEIVGEKGIEYALTMAENDVWPC